MSSWQGILNQYWVHTGHQPVRYGTIPFRARYRVHEIVKNYLSSMAILFNLNRSRTRLELNRIEPELGGMYQCCTVSVLFRFFLIF